MSQSRLHAQRAIAIDEGLAAGHEHLGVVHLLYEQDWRSAERELLRALQLDPITGYAHNAYAGFLRARGLIEEAHEVQAQFLRLAPTNFYAHCHMAYQYCHEGKYEETLDQCRKARTLRPKSVGPLLIMQWAYIQQGRLQDAIDALEEARLIDDGPDLMGALGFVYGQRGQTEDALLILKEMELLQRQRYVSPYFFALVHIGLGSTNEVFRYLNLAVEEHAMAFLLGYAFPGLMTDPRWDPLRVDPRFSELVQRLGLPGKGQPSADE